MMHSFVERAVEHRLIALIARTLDCDLTRVRDTTRFYDLGVVSSDDWDPLVTALVAETGVSLDADKCADDWHKVADLIDYFTEYFQR